MTAYTVTTKFGTFTRKTGRNYTHLVVSVLPNGFAYTNWCGRADLAQKAAAQNVGLGFAIIAIVDVATGDAINVYEAAVAV